MIYLGLKYLKGGHRINYVNTQNSDQCFLLAWMVLSGKVLSE